MYSCLTDILVVDLSRILAGPMAAQHLADMGAKVIKVERKTKGDESRGFGPPFLKDQEGKDTDQSPMYLSANRNKKSIEIDFTNKDDINLIKSIIKKADVLIENFKVGDLDKYGLDYASIEKLNSKIIYCSITGYGQTGPYRKRPGYDSIFQAESGLMSVTGHPDGFPGDGPMKVGPSIADVVTGLYASNAILSTLMSRKDTGKGAYIDISLLESMIAGLGHFATQYLVTGIAPKRLGSQGNGGVPAQIFKCRDGQIMMTAGNQKQYEAFCTAIKLPELITDQRFSTNQNRVKNRWELSKILEEHIIKMSSGELLNSLQKNGVPSGKLNTLEQVFEDEHVIEREVVQKITSELYGDVMLVKNPINIRTMNRLADTAPPVIGQNNEDYINYVKKDIQ